MCTNNLATVTTCTGMTRVKRTTASCRSNVLTITSLVHHLWAHDLRKGDEHLTYAPLSSMTWLASLLFTTMPCYINHNAHNWPILPCCINGTAACVSSWNEKQISNAIFKITATHRPLIDISKSKPKLNPVHRQQYYNSTIPQWSS